MKKQSKSNKNEIAERLNRWKKLKTYLHTHVTIQDLSKEIGINRTYLSNFINRTYGENFNNWMNGLRTDEAKKEILSTPEAGLSEIARKVGFADLAHFSKVFKRKEGISPSEWKKQNSENDETDA